jgi:hypothetical protein
VSYDPRLNPYAPPTGQPPLAGSWTRPLRPVRPEPGDGTDDGLVHLAGMILAGLAALFVATGAAAVGLAAYGIITWRRARWWAPILVGFALAFLVVVVLGGPGPALHQHLTALRELTEPHSHGLGQIAAQRWPVWLLTQLPLGAPVGLIAAGRPVLGAWVSGDLAGWKAGEWCTIPDATLTAAGIPTVTALAAGPAGPIPKHGRPRSDGRRRAPRA